MKKIVFYGLFQFVILFAFTPLASNAETTGGSVFDTGKTWRYHFVWGAEPVLWESGVIKSFSSDKQKGIVPSEEKLILTPLPPANWFTVDFDDSEWVPAPGPVLHAPFRNDLAILSMRTAFLVPEIPSAGELKLVITFRGGIVVYLNGQELIRKYLPAGELAPDVSGEPYSKECYVDSSGKLLPYDSAASTQPNFSDPRLRKIETVIPVSALRKGINILAVQLRRSPHLEIYYKADRSGQKECEWSTLGFHSVSLTSSGIPVICSDVCNACKIAVWRGNPLCEVWDSDTACFDSKPKLSIAGTRNGAFSGLLLLRSMDAVREIKVETEELQHVEKAGKISKTNVKIRYGIGGDQPPAHLKHFRRPSGASYLGVLSDTFISVPALKTFPLLVTIDIPDGAPAGKYTGNIRIVVNDGVTITIPVELSVAGWTLPHPNNYSSFANLIQSPESVALQYQVPLWSEEHWKLLERTFSLLGQVGVKVILVPLIGRTNEGNEHSMVRWSKQADGSWKHDFSVVERYVGLAVKYLGTNIIVCCQPWMPLHGGGSFGTTPDVAKNQQPMLFSVLEPDTGVMKLEKGPDWGTPESRTFWQPVFEGVRAVLKKFGLERNMAVGIACDFTPSRQAVEDINSVAPEARWIMHAHSRAEKFAGKDLAVDACVWGIKEPLPVMHPNRRFGWANRIPTTVFPRYGAGSMGHVHSASPLALFHAVLECYQCSGYNGIDRVGADYWLVAKDARGKPAPVTSRFPTRDRPGSPTMTVGAFLYPGKDGAVATFRFEALRMGQQETEARIYLEKVIRDKQLSAKLDPQLVNQIIHTLDERLEWIRRGKRDRSAMYSIGTDASWMSYAQDYNRRAGLLFELADRVCSLVQKSSQ